MASRAEMLSRIAHYDNRREDTGAFLDITLPGHARTTMLLVGSGTGNDPNLRAPLPPEDFTVGMQKATTGNGPGLHSHTTVEVFVSMSGTWRLYWIDDEGEADAELGPWDVASVPAGVWRGLSLVSEGEGLLLAVRGGPDGGGIAWHPSIIEAAAEQGRTLDESGRLVVAGAE